jgi:hypothetical protein
VLSVLKKKSRPPSKPFFRFQEKDKSAVPRGIGLFIKRRGIYGRIAEQRGKE